jgi:hypothetical protein
MDMGKVQDCHSERSEESLRHCASALFFIR